MPQHAQIVLAASHTGFDTTRLQALMLGFFGCVLIYQAIKVVAHKQSGDIKAAGGGLGVALIGVIIAGLGAAALAYAVVGPALLRTFGVNI